MNDVIKELERQILQHQRNLLRQTAELASLQLAEGGFVTKEQRKLNSLEKDFKLLEAKLTESEELNRKLIKKYVFSEGNYLKYDIILYGAGKYGKLWGSQLKAYDISIAAYVDSNPENCGKVINGIKVIAFSEVLARKKEILWLVSVANTIAKKEISELLHKKGYKDIAYSVMETLQILSL